MHRKLATEHRAQNVTYVALKEFNTEKIDNILNLTSTNLRNPIKRILKLMQA